MKDIHLKLIENKKALKIAEELVKVEVSLPFRFSFDFMEKGVLQHLDRNYTYDVIPAELQGGLLFQGIHRPPEGTVLTITLLRPAGIYFFFHEEVNGGYSDIFANLEGWERCDIAPH